MVESNKKVELFKRIEFWAITLTFIIIIFSLIIHPITSQAAIPEVPLERYDLPFQLMKHLVIYGMFLLFNYRIAPAIAINKKLFSSLGYAIAVVMVGGLLFSFIIIGLRSPVFEEVQGEARVWKGFAEGFQYSFIIALFYLGYALIKYTGIYLLSRFDQIRTRVPFATTGGIICFIIWALIFYLAIIDGSEPGFLVMWGTIIPFGILFYWFCLARIIPRKTKKKWPRTSYVFTSILWLALSMLPLFLLLLILIQDAEVAITFSFFNAIVQLFVTSPLAWIIYKRRGEVNEEISGLKKQLGQSTASFDFLRSQINPHFLFNSLNTLYGTAILEKAEQTAQGVQQLGDMMRFMLQENMRERIPLSREIDYLENYISLQRLRTDKVSGVQIETDIQRGTEEEFIAPMLLIPLVENAFKHGVSLTKSSHVYIALERTPTSIVFIVINSRHDKQHRDPEKHKSGIGLENVKQRLELLYPNRHSLGIQETDKEFIAKLVVQLD
ncbi:MAG TPA: histidine kinase [Chitinophagaceae bacterium]|nr:histidine kinase [Chitinophagaceae bacterium]